MIERLMGSLKSHKAARVLDDAEVEQLMAEAEEQEEEEVDDVDNPGT